MYRFFVEKEQIVGEEVQIRGTDVNHIKHVLRMKVGEPIRISDKKEMDYLCEIVALSEDEVRAKIVEAKVGETELLAELILFQGLPKSDKLEWIIQKAVELGVAKVFPVAMKHSVVKIEPKKETAKQKRWNSIAESAAKQSKRLIVPQVGEVLSYAACVEQMKELDLVLLPYECAEGMEGTKQALAKLQKGSRVGIVIGPEGGFAEEEVAAAKEAGAQIVSLGKRILRTETAGLAMLSILMYHLETM
ncbi:MAG: 16S rRNA (uracil(1498)-N(3))-methyltransferase [bacterium]|nr:16S rRNA (uracil(1498)-N(3))-methyltransferase [bacterium]